jgi:hypothetical protein
LKPLILDKMKNFISFILVIIFCATHIAFAQYGGSSYGLGTGGASSYINPMTSGYGGLGGAGYGLGGNPYAGALSAPGYGKGNL